MNLFAKCRWGLLQIFPLLDIMCMVKKAGLRGMSGNHWVRQIGSSKFRPTWSHMDAFWSAVFSSSNREGSNLAAICILRQTIQIISAVGYLLVPMVAWFKAGLSPIKCDSRMILNLNIWLVTIHCHVLVRWGLQRLHGGQYLLHQELVGGEFRDDL